MKYRTISRCVLTVICLLTTISNFIIRPNLALAYAASGQLAFVRDVTVNGSNAVSGQTVFSGNTIKVGSKGTAIINLGKLGRIELGANSELTLLIGENSIGGTLTSGCMAVNAPAGVSIEASTSRGKVETQGNQATSFFLGIKSATVNVYPNLGEINVTAGNKSEIARPGQMAMMTGDGLQVLSNSVCRETGITCACDPESVPDTNTPSSNKPPVIASGSAFSAGLIAILFGTVGASTAAVLGLSGSSGNGLTCVNGVGILCQPVSPTVPSNP